MGWVEIRIVLDEVERPGGHLRIVPDPGCAHWPENDEEIRFTAWPAPGAAAARPSCAELRRGAQHPRLDIELTAPGANPAHHAAPSAQPVCGHAGRQHRRSDKTLLA